MKKVMLNKELSPDEILKFEEIVISDEGCNRCRNEAHFSPRGEKRFVDYYHVGQFYKRYTEFSRFNNGMYFDKFVRDLNMAIGAQEWDKTVKVWGLVGLNNVPKKVN